MRTTALARDLAQDNLKFAWTLAGRMTVEEFARLCELTLAMLRHAGEEEEDGDQELE